MKKPLVVFGTGEIGELASYYFSTDSAFDLAAFTVDAAFMAGPTFCGRPVVPFEDLASQYPPDRFSVFVAVSYSKLNAVRKEKYLAAKGLGYPMASYVSSRATVLNEGRIGDNCF